MGETVAHPRPATGGTQVGYRVGDAGPLEGQGPTRRLHELIGMPLHALLLLLGEADPSAAGQGLALASAAAERYRPHVQAYVVTRSPRGEDAPGALFSDPTGALHGRLGADRPSLCLVRPDGHLGLRTEPPSLDALQAHLEGIFRSG